MEVTNEIKFKIFGQYLNAPCIIQPKFGNRPFEGHNTLDVMLNIFNTPEQEIHKYESASLLLKNLSSISDEDAIKVCEILDIDECKVTKRDILGITLECEYEYSVVIGYSGIIRVFHGINYCGIASVMLLPYQYLMSKGYALPQLVIIDGKPVTLSVEKQVELGIIELTK